MNKLFVIALMATVLVGCDKSGGSGRGSKVVIPPEEIVEPSPETPVPVPFDPDEAYPDAQPLPIGVVVPIPQPIDIGDIYPDPQPLPIGVPTRPECVGITWEMPTARTNGDEFTEVEIANVIVVIEPSAFDDVNVWQNIYDRGTLEERITAGDPLIHFLDYNATSVDCDELDIRGDVWHWYGVVVIDVNGIYSDTSELVHPGQIEDE